MPLPYKIALSLIVAVLAGLIGWLEFHGPQPHLAMVIGAIAAVMLFGLWVFPEAGGGKPGQTSKS
jgi:hypothetical protein